MSQIRWSNLACRASTLRMPDGPERAGHQRASFLGAMLARRSRLGTRYLAAAAGLWLSIALCLLFGLLNFLDSAAVRADARQFGPEDPEGCIVGAFRGDQFEQHQYERIVVAKAERADCAEPPAPPGLARFPEPNQVFVSPALARLRSTSTVMAERYPTIAGTIGKEGLISANELRVIVGGDEPFHDRTMNVSRFDRFGSSNDWVAGYLRIDASSLLYIGILFCIPLSIWLIYTAALVNARVRERQLGVLAVVGLDARGTCQALVTEATITVGVGAVLGAVASKHMLATLTPTFAGLQAFRGDYEPGWSTLIRVTTAVILVSLGASLVAAFRSVFAEKHRERSARNRRSTLGLTLLAVGAGGGVAALFSSSLREMRSVILAGEIITFVGIVLVVPLLARTLGASCLEARSELGVIVGSRLRRPSGSLCRAVATLAGGLFIISLAQTTTAAVVEDPQALADYYASDGRSLLVVRYPNEEVLRLVQPYEVLSGTDPMGDARQVLSGSCSAVQEATGSTEPCSGDAIYFTFGDSEPVSEVVREVGFPVEADLPQGPRGDQLLEQIVRLTEPGHRTDQPDTVYIPVPVNETGELYDHIIAASPSINVRIAGAENVSGTTELNSIADVFRWGGFLTVGLSLLGVAIAVIALAYDSRLGTQYLEVLGFTRLRSAIALVGELVMSSTAAALVAGACAWIWGTVYTVGRDVEAASMATVAKPFVVGVVAVAAIGVLIPALAIRSARNAVIDGENDAIRNLHPFARTKNRIMRSAHSITPIGNPPPTQH